MVVKKFADALPLYRREQMRKRLGVNLKRNTMDNWVVLTAETYLKPFSDALFPEKQGISLKRVCKKGRPCGVRRNASNFHNHSRRQRIFQGNR